MHPNVTSVGQGIRLVKPRVSAAIALDYAELSSLSTGKTVKYGLTGFVNIWYSSCVN